MEIVNFKKRKSVRIHATAIIHPKAQIGENVEIGPFALIDEGVVIGDNCIIGPHVIIEGQTTIGANNRFYHGGTIGCRPQLPKFQQEDTSLVIGDENIFRENVTISRGFTKNGENTHIGNKNLFMANAHVGHNCRIGDHIILGNYSALSGNVLVEERVIISGYSSVYDTVRIGKMAMVGACSKIVKDIPPYILIDGNPANVAGINVVGLRRSGMSSGLRDEIKRAYKILYRSNLTLAQALEQMESDLANSVEIKHFVNFLTNIKRGIIR